MDSSCAVIIASCKAYSDSWGPFFTQFFKYWPDCPFPIYLITEGGEQPDLRVSMLILQKDNGWSDNVRYALDVLGVSHVLYILDDVPFMSPVDTKRIKALLALMRTERAAYLRLFPAPEPTQPYKQYTEVGLVDSTAPYRTSTMAALWDVKTLKDLLVPKENAWQFEILGTERSRTYPRPFLSVWKKDGPAINHFATAIKKGRWQWDAVRFLKREGVEVDRSRRAVETFWIFLLRQGGRVPGLAFLIRNIRKIVGGNKPSVLVSK